LRRQRGLWHPATVPPIDDAIDLLRRAFMRLTPSQRLALLHAVGRFAPWEGGFDFTPPPLAEGEQAGPPDFVGIGVQKAGTTWWHQLISSHPDVWSRADLHKERHFFDRFGAKPFRASDIVAYHGWFPRPEGKVTGEWTPDYFTMPWTPPLLQAAAPAAKLLLLLRDPVERFRSGLDHQKQVGLPCDGATIADAVNRGFYDRALSWWEEHFDHRQLLILQHERCVVDRDRQLGATFAFLGLDDHRVPETELPSRAGASSASSSLPDELRQRLVDLYAPDVLAVASRLPEVDLSLWPNFAHLAA
jgi:Sulfotransferase domain